MRTLQITIGVAVLSFLAVGAYVMWPMLGSAPAPAVVSDSEQQAPTGAAPVPQTTSTVPATKPAIQTPTAPAVDSRCIVTIDGTKYNVTDFRKQHKGGDVFKCGTDMSTAFHNQHGVQMLEKIKNLVVQ